MVSERFWNIKGVIPFDTLLDDVGENTAQVLPALNALSGCNTIRKLVLKWQLSSVLRLVLLI